MMTKTLTISSDYLPPETLIDRCIRGERTAQKQLYDQYKTAMFTLALRIVNDHYLACDVLQDAFLEVFKDLVKFRGESTLGAWIKTIVTRKAIRKIKYEYRYLPFEENEHDSIVEQFQNVNSRLIDRAISALPNGYRSVFIMVEVEGFSHKEVAELLGVTENTSRSQLHHAKKQLQTLLKELKP